MNLVYANIIKLFSDDGQRFGKVSVNGVLKNVHLFLLEDVRVGDRILLCDGIAIAKVKNVKNGGDHVSCNTGQSA